MEREIDPEGLSRNEMREAIKACEKEEEVNIEIEKLKLELEEREKDKQREFELKRLEIEDRAMERQREYELRIRELELDRSRHTHTESNSGSSVKGPRIPTFREGEDIEVYLTTFERLAEANEWPREVWAARLAAVLTGKARQAYVRMDLAESKDYDKVKAAVLKRYDRDAEYYRTKFRESRKEGDESFKEWAIRTLDYFSQWVREVGDDMGKLKELIVLEQLMSSTTPELQVWLKQREPTTLQQFADLADVYRSSRRGTLHRSGRTVPEQGKVTAVRPQMGEGRSDEVRAPRGNTMGNGRNEFRSRDRATFVTCFKCGQKGHYQSDCRTVLKQVDPTSKRETSFWICQQLHEDERVSLQLPQRSQLETLGENQTGKLKLTRPCWVNGRQAVMVLDTGSSFSLVSKRNVSEKDYTGGSVDVVGVGQQVCPLASVTVQIDPSGPAYRVLAGVRDEADGPDMILSYDDMERLFNVKIRDLLAPLLAGNEVESYFVETRSAKRDREKEESKAQAQAQLLGTRVTGVIATEVDRLSASIEELTRQLGNVPDDPESNSLVREGNQHAEDAIPVDGSFRSAPNDSKVEDSSELGLDLGADQIRKLQQEDPTLNVVRDKVIQDRDPSTLGNGSFFRKDGLIYRRWVNSSQGGQKVDQLVVPRLCRTALLTVAHAIPLAGHMGIEKSRERLLAHFFWPNIYEDVRNFCNSCPECQKSTGKVLDPPAKLQPIPPMGLPFRKIFIDIVGPLPRSENGYRYILSIVDLNTRYPEAVPLKTQTTEEVADALIGVFARVGIPQEIASDQGSNFMSRLMKELCDQLQIRRVTTTPYHQAANGLVERWNQTMKNMLRRMVHDSSHQWDRLLPYVLFAYREIPESSTGFSPFELLYGWPVRGPLSVIKESWVSNDEDDRNLLQHVIDVRTRMVQSVEMAHENLKDSQKNMKSWYDQKARDKAFVEGDEVLVLLPESKKSLEAKWQGPFRVMRKVSDLNYEVDVGGSRKSLRTYHVNLLRKWKSRQETVMYVDHLLEDSEVASPVSLTWEDVVLSDKLSKGEVEQLRELLKEFSSSFSDRPRVTDVIEHHIGVQGAEPIRQAPYRMPQACKEEFNQEIQGMLEMGVIVESQSEWSSPIVVVPKTKDGEKDGLRICIDFKKVNALTKFDAYPLPRIEDLIENLCNAKYISKLDLTKGYWAIPLTRESRDKTAFRVPGGGLYEFTVLPFGLKTAGVTFTRMMAKVLKGAESFTAAYLDDIVIQSMLTL